MSIFSDLKAKDGVELGKFPVLIAGQYLSIPIGTVVLWRKEGDELTYAGKVQGYEVGSQNPLKLDWNSKGGVRNTHHHPSDFSHFQIMEEINHAISKANEANDKHLH